MIFKPLVVKRCEYSNYFRVNQTSFQTGVDKSAFDSCLTFCWFISIEIAFAL
jgi:hypothetical protein